MKKRRKFAVLAPEIVEQIAGMKAGAPELYLSSHALFPSGYMEYLMEVLSINPVSYTHLPVWRRF